MEIADAFTDQTRCKLDKAIAERIDSGRSPMIFSPDKNTMLVSLADDQPGWIVDLSGNQPPRRAIERSCAVSDKGALLAVRGDGLRLLLLIDVNSSRRIATLNTMAN